jgi:acyl-CoA synthetase (AMP-forming)/AMP-acid ligase II
MISHRNVIANMLQKTTFEREHRRNESDVILGVLPQSYSFSLIDVSHGAIYNGDGVVILPNFDLQQLLQAIQDFQMTRLYMVWGILHPRNM